ncbi:MAG: homoserine dehydrogenase [Candidatus Omnitrophica bacterium]|nr:homoserine dehydrogenase [Candidatus Omnitrophota bacterium]
MKQIKIGLLGLGQIGSGVYQLLTRKKSLLQKKAGVSFEIQKIAVKNPRKSRKISVRRDLITTESFKVARNGNVDCVVELVGGIRPAKDLILQALRSGKDVVTANKALLAEHGKEIFRTAAQKGRRVFFEASVGGGIPVIKALREGLIGNEIQSVLAIINGTTNYILTRMTQDRLDFKQALALAQSEGYAERDPRLDIDGIDSGHKLAILASLAFDQPVSFRDLSCEGISRIEHRDIEFAGEFGYVVKLLALAKKVPAGIEARVQPTLLAKDHILAKVDGAYNAILFRGDEVGEMLLYGKGAGSRPTASAVVSDLVDLALDREDKKKNPWLSKGKARVRRGSSLPSRYYLRFSVIDKPGVLAKISGVLGRHRVSISGMIQTERKVGNVVPLIMITHHAGESAVRAAQQEINRLRVISGKPQVIRIED